MAVYCMCIYRTVYDGICGLKIADIFNGLMAIPNLIAIVALSGVVVAETRKYMEQVAQGERAGAKRRQRAWRTHRKAR